MSTQSYLFTDTADDAVNPSLLQQEINTAGLTTISYINTNDPAIDIVFSTVLSGPDITTLNGVVETHNGLEIFATTSLASTGTLNTMYSITVAQTENRTLTLPDATTTVVGNDVAQELFSKILTATSNTCRATEIGTSGANVVISPTGPTTNQILTATSTDAANWQTPFAGPFEKSWAVSSPSGGGATFYVGGFYIDAGNDFSFTSVPTSTTLGTVNVAYGAHVYLVIGSTVESDLVITVSGTSITDNVERTTGDSEAVTFSSGSGTNSYCETSKKWIGQVTLTWTSGPSPVSANYGFSKYWDNGNTQFTICGLECVWLAGSSDSSVNISLIHHKTTGWTYNADSSASPSVLADLSSDYVTDDNFANGQEGAWKRTNLSEIINGDTNEGVLYRFTTSLSNTFRTGTASVIIQSS